MTRSLAIDDSEDWQGSQQRTPTLAGAATMPPQRTLHRIAWGSASQLPRDLSSVAAQRAATFAGTHDNSTTAGWWADDAGEGDRALLREYAGFDGGDLAWFMIRLAMESVANTSIFSMQVRPPPPHRQVRTS